VSRPLFLDDLGRMAENRRCGLEAAVKRSAWSRAGGTGRSLPTGRVSASRRARDGKIPDFGSERRSEDLGRTFPLPAQRNNAGRSAAIAGDSRTRQFSGRSALDNCAVN